MRKILSEEQIKLLPLIEKFSKEFGLVGGTAVALQIGHRRSIDFDLFTLKPFNSDKIRETIRLTHNIGGVLVDNPNELTLVVDSVKITFYKYPFQIEFPVSFENIMKLPNLVALGAMKAFALGKRAKWKDYVDLYFIFKKHSFLEIINKAKEVFGSEFNDKLFREELSYFADIDYSETIDYLPGFEIKNEIVKSYLQEISLQK